MTSGHRTAGKSRGCEGRYRW